MPAIAASGVSPFWKGGGLVDAPGRGLEGAKTDNPHWPTYLLRGGATLQAGSTYGSKQASHAIDTPSAQAVLPLEAEQAIVGKVPPVEPGEIQQS